MRLDAMTIDDLDALMGKLDSVYEAGKLLVGVGLRPVFSLTPGFPLMTVPPMVMSEVPANETPLSAIETAIEELTARIEDQADRMALTEKSVVPAEESGGLVNGKYLDERLKGIDDALGNLHGRMLQVEAGPNIDALAEQLDHGAKHFMGACEHYDRIVVEQGQAILDLQERLGVFNYPETSAAVGQATTTEAEAEPETASSTASTPAAPAVSDEADKAGEPLPEPSTEPAPTLVAVQVDDAPAPQLQAVAEVEAPAGSPPPAGAGPQLEVPTRWTEIEISAAITIYVDTIMLGGEARQAYELIGTKYHRTAEAVRQRFMTAWKSKAHQALQQARNDEAKAIAKSRPDYVDPLTLHLSMLPHPKGWSYAADLELVTMNLDRVDPATIAANLEVTPVFIKARWDVLTGQYKDANDKLCRRWTGPEIAERLQQLITDQVKRSVAAE